jgi:hypothetical protein
VAGDKDEREDRDSRLLGSVGTSRKRRLHHRVGMNLRLVGETADPIVFIVTLASATLLRRWPGRLEDRLIAKDSTREDPTAAVTIGSGAGELDEPKWTPTQAGSRRGRAVHPGRGLSIMTTRDLSGTHSG